MCAAVCAFFPIAAMKSCVGAQFSPDQFVCSISNPLQSLSFPTSALFFAMQSIPRYMVGLLQNERMRLSIHPQGSRRANFTRCSSSPISTFLGGAAIHSHSIHCYNNELPSLLLSWGSSSDIFSLFVGVPVFHHIGVVNSSISQFLRRCLPSY